MARSWIGILAWYRRVQFKSPHHKYAAVPNLSDWHVGALPDRCRRTEGWLSPTLAAKGYDLPTHKQKAALIGFNQVNDDEKKEA